MVLKQKTEQSTVQVSAGSVQIHAKCKQSVIELFQTQPCNSSHTNSVDTVDFGKIMKQKTTQTPPCLKFWNLFKDIFQNDLQPLEIVLWTQEINPPVRTVTGKSYSSSSHFWVKLSLFELLGFLHQTDTAWTPVFASASFLAAGGFCLVKTVETNVRVRNGCRYQYVLTRTTGACLNMFPYRQTTTHNQWSIRMQINICTLYPNMISDLHIT